MMFSNVVQFFYSFSFGFVKKDGQASWTTIIDNDSTPLCFYLAINKTAFFTFVFLNFKWDMQKPPLPNNETTKTTVAKSKESELCQHKKYCIQFIERIVL